MTMRRKTKYKTIANAAYKGKVIGRSDHHQVTVSGIGAKQSMLTCTTHLPRTTTQKDGAWAKLKYRCINRDSAPGQESHKQFERDGWF